MNEIDSYLKDNPDFRLGESDGNYFRYERYPSSRLESGFCIKTIEGEYLVYTLPYEQSQKYEEKDHEGEISVISPENPKKSNIRRDVLIWLCHYPENKDNHVIQFVIDQRSQDHGNGEVIGPHINIREEDSEEFFGCEECVALFDWLNHYEVNFEEREKFKEIDLDTTVNQIKEFLIEEDFGNKYHLNFED